MAESEQSQRKARRADDREVEELAPADTAHKAELDSEVDSLLDEIDDVLEVVSFELMSVFRAGTSITDLRVAPGTSSTSVASSATTFAVRGLPVRAAISPKKSPGPIADSER